MICPNYLKILKNDVSLRERIVITDIPYSFVEDEDKIKGEPLVYKPIDRTIKKLLKLKFRGEQ